MASRIFRASGRRASTEPAVALTPVASVRLIDEPQAAFQMPSLWREGYRYEWITPWRDATVRRVIRQMIPGTIGTVIPATRHFSTKR